MNVLFDLDGTLTNPEVGITRCIRHATLTQLGHDCPHDDLRWCIGPPLRESFAKLSGSDDPELLTRLIESYRVRFHDVGIMENEPYEGVGDMLASLRLAGYRLYVATSKPVVYACRIVSHFGFDSYFEGVFGSELDGTRERKDEVIGHLMSQEGIAPEHSTMVGDRYHDIAGARAHGLAAIGVLYGFGTEVEFADAQAVCRTPAEVPGAVARLKSAGL